MYMLNLHLVSRRNQIVVVKHTCELSRHRSEPDKYVCVACVATLGNRTAIVLKLNDHLGYVYYNCPPPPPPY
jgi:hypothetical protein